MSAATPDLSKFLPPPAQINDTHKHYDVAAAIIFMLVVGTFVGVARLWCQWRASIFGLEDWALIPALLLYTGHSIMAVYCNLNAGVGKPLWEVTYGEFQIWYKGMTGTTFLYPAMTASVRISILLFYYRIFGRTHIATRWIIYVLLSLTAVYIVVFSILPGFICRPLSFAWRLLDDRASHCQSNDWYYQYTVSLYATSAAFDFLLLVTPMYPVTQLQMSWKKRVGAMVMFALGASSCIAASYKLGIFVQQWGRIGHIDPRWATNIMSLLVPPQFDKYGETFWIPSQVEPTTAVIGASLPALRRVLQPGFEQMTTAFRSLMTGQSSSQGTKGSPSSSRKTGSASLDDQQHPFAKMETPTTREIELHSIDQSV